MGTFKSPAMENTDNVKNVEPAPFTPSGILHFTISVADLDEAIEFYTTIVGATLWRRISYSALWRSVTTSLSSPISAITGGLTTQAIV